MEKYILNETPLRTANNFGINNIEAYLELPKYKEFDNFNLYTEDLEKIKIKITKNTLIDNENRLGLERKINYSIKINIPQNTKVQEKIKLEFNFDEENEFLVENVEIILEKIQKLNSKYYIVLKQIIIHFIMVN